MDQLNEMRDQVKNFGIPVSKILDHGFCKSCYFTDPTGYNIELACTVRGYTDDEWDLTVLDRQLREEENMHSDSDNHGKNVVKPKL